MLSSITDWLHISTETYITPAPSTPKNHSEHFEKLLFNVVKFSFTYIPLFHLPAFLYNTAYDLFSGLGLELTCLIHTTCLCKHTVSWCSVHIHNSCRVILCQNLLGILTQLSQWTPLQSLPAALFLVNSALPSSFIGCAYIIVFFFSLYVIFKTEIIAVDLYIWTWPIIQPSYH